MKILLVRKIVSLLVSSLVFCVCIQYILTTFQWKNIIPIIENADFLWLIGAGVVSILIFCLLRTWRWFILLKNLNIKINYIDLHLCNTASISLTIVTPFQSGEVLKVELLKKSGLIERFSGYSSFVTERIIDLFVVISIAAISVLNSSNLGINRSSIVYMWAILLLLLIAGGLAVYKIQAKGKISKFFSHLRACTRNVKSLLLVILLTFGSWAMVAMGWQICLYSISINLGFQKAMTLMSMTTIINILSFVPGAVGVAEVSSAEFLTRMDLNLVSAQAGALILRFYSVLIIFVGAIHFLIWKILSIRRV